MCTDFLLLYNNNISPLKHTIIINKSVNAALEQGSRIMSPGRLYCILRLYVYLTKLMLKIGFVKEKLAKTKLGRKNPRGGKSAPPGQLGLKRKMTLPLLVI